MKHCYLIVPQAFKDAYEGTRVGACTLVTATTKDGRIVVSTNAPNEFRDIFQQYVITDFLGIVWLAPDDFPASTAPMF